MLVGSLVFCLSHVRNLGVRMSRVMLFCYALRGHLGESGPALNLCVTETEQHRRRRTNKIDRESIGCDKACRL